MAMQPVASHSGHQQAPTLITIVIVIEWVTIIVIVIVYVIDTWAI